MMGFNNYLIRHNRLEVRSWDYESNDDMFSRSAGLSLTRSMSEYDTYYTLPFNKIQSDMAILVNKNTIDVNDNVPITQRHIHPMSIPTKSMVGDGYVIARG